MRIFKIIMLTLLFLLMAAIPVLAAKDSLAGKTSEDVSVWGVDLRSTQIYGNQGLLLGGFDGWKINDSLLIGTEGYILLNPIQAPNAVQNYTLLYNIGLAYGGLKCEYNLNPGKSIHFSGDLLAGVGYVKYVASDYNFSAGSGGICFVVEPGVNAMLKFTDSTQVGLGISYRLVSGLKINGLTDSDLTGVSVNLIIRYLEF